MSKGDVWAWGRQEEASRWSPEPQLLVSTQVNQRDFESEKRLRKDLKRTKALLVDAQIMLDHLKNNAPSKREIAQLKNQVPAERISSAPGAAELIFCSLSLPLVLLSGS